MAYPPPPGLRSSPPSNSLPPRPPPSGPQLPLRAGSQNDPRPQPGGGGFGGLAFQPRSVASSAPRTHSPMVSALPAPPAGLPGAPTYQNNTAQPPQQQPPYQRWQQQYTTPDPPYAQPQAPVIRNPFAPPPAPTAAGQSGPYHAVDPDMEAQIAAWQNQYLSKDEPGRNSARPPNREAPPPPPAGATGQSLSSSDLTSAANADTGVASVVTGADGKQRTVVRSGGGKTWQDSSLLEWDPAHFRLFVGNLAGEVTDESLLKAFAKYTSVQKARVVRDKRTTKSKGYGFVSFGDGDDYFQAAREMQGKYIGSHPVLLRKSTTEIKAVVPRDKKHGKANKNGGPANHDKTGAGVSKKRETTRNGLKILG